MKKKVFVVLKFGVEGCLEQALRIVYEVEKKLGVYCQLIPSRRALFTYKPEDYRLIDELFNALGYMREADVVVFPPHWQSSREFTLLHAIACAYELNIMELDTPNEKIKLKPCPFCGEDEQITVALEDTEHGKEFSVFCPTCGTDGPTGITERMAVELWNNRENGSVAEDAD